MRRFEKSDLAWMELPASIDSLERFRSFVLEKAGELSPPGELLRNLELVLEELLVNVISYAYPEGENGAIEVGCGEVEGGMFCIQIRDRGKPFDPLSLPDPDLTLGILDRPVGGLGIYFVRQLAEFIQYDYVDNSNRLTCCFRCPS